jgi:hypothetical protein
MYLGGVSFNGLIPLNTFSAKSNAWGPESRTIAIPASPQAVDMEAIVSL